MAFADTTLSRALVSAARPASRRPSSNLFVRAIGVLADARRRQAERAIGRYIEENGGRMTDDLERRISRRYGSSVE